MAGDRTRSLAVAAACAAAISIGVAQAQSRPAPVDDCPFAVRLDTVWRVAYSTGMNGNRLTMFPLGRVEASLGR